MQLDVIHHYEADEWGIHLRGITAPDEDLHVEGRSKDLRRLLQEAYDEKHGPTDGNGITTRQAGATYA